MSNGAKVAQFEWNDTRSRAALGLAEGKTQQHVADECAIGRRTLVRWLEHPDFAAEVDRLSVMTHIASSAERLRIAKRVVRQMVKDDQKIKTEKDLLDWLKFAQSETDGISVGLAKLAAALGANETSVAD
jgi:hypothetical protein